MAQADPVFTVSEPAALEGERQGSDRFAVNGIEIACNEVLFSGELDESSETLELQAEHDECTANVLTGLIADFFQEACDYVLHDLRQAGQGPWWKAEVDLKCTGGYWAIGWDFFETEARYREGRDACSIRVIKQPDAGTAEVRDLGGGEDGIEVRWDLPRLDYRVYTVGGFASSLLCGSLAEGIADDASYTGTATVSATGPAELRVTG